jgi:hypothetical protein
MEAKIAELHTTVVEDASGLLRLQPAVRCRANNVAYCRKTSMLSCYKKGTDAMGSGQVLSRSELVFRRTYNEEYRGRSYVRLNTYDTRGRVIPH